MDALDLLIISRSFSGDDESFSYERLVGDLDSRVICFLPWRVPLGLARRIGLIPPNFLACYEIPAALVSSDPWRCVAALDLLVADAHALIKHISIDFKDVTVIGLSIGSAPATRLANSIGARLCSVTSADRGDLMLWESIAARDIKRRAEWKGYRVEDFGQAFVGHNPVENLRNLKANSVFISSDRDAFVPEPRSRNLLRAVQRVLPSATIVTMQRGHVRTLLRAVSQLPDLIAG